MLRATTVVLNVDTAVKYIHSYLPQMNAFADVQREFGDFFTDV